MSNKVLLKKSSVASKIPLTTDLDYGELALNYADEKIYFKNSANEIKAFSTAPVASSGGLGSLSVNDTCSGTTPKIITTIFLDAGTYNNITATIGCNNTTDTAVLSIYKDSTLLSTVSSTGLPALVSLPGFTLNSYSNISLYLNGTTQSTISFVYGIGIK